MLFISPPIETIPVAALQHVVELPDSDGSEVALVALVHRARRNPFLSGANLIRPE
jgi:hypothetical protein